MLIDPFTLFALALNRLALTVSWKRNLEPFALKLKLRASLAYSTPSPYVRLY